MAASLPKNNRGEQRKIIKFNHPLANCLIVHNARMMTRALLKLRADGVQIDPDGVAARGLRPAILSPMNSGALTTGAAADD